MTVKPAVRPQALGVWAAHLDIWQWGPGGSKQGIQSKARGMVAGLGAVSGLQEENAARLRGVSKKSKLMSQLRYICSLRRSQRATL